MPPLRLFLLFHPQSAGARAFAERLMDHFVEPPASGGLRIPVLFTPDRGDGMPPSLEGEDPIDLDSAENTIVVFLADQTMVQALRPTDRGRQWQQFHDQLKQLETERQGASEKTGRLHVFVVSLDGQGYQLSPRQHVVDGQLQVKPIADDGNASPEETAWSADERRRYAENRRLDEVSLQVSIRAIQLLTRGNVADKKAEEMEIPVCLFLSHAKNDLDRDKFQKKLIPDDPIHYVMTSLQGLPIEQWFDSEQTRPGSEFGTAIKAGLVGSTTVDFTSDSRSRLSSHLSVGRPKLERPVIRLLRQIKQIGRLLR